jgi:hypothetical protein
MGESVGSSDRGRIEAKDREGYERQDDKWKWKHIALGVHAEDWTEIRRQPQFLCPCHHSWWMLWNKHQHLVSLSPFLRKGSSVWPQHLRAATRWRQTGSLMRDLSLWFSLSCLGFSSAFYIPCSFMITFGTIPISLAVCLCLLEKDIDYRHLLKHKERERDREG